MTNEEAIFYIKELQKTYASMDKKVSEAIDMAIEALQTEGAQGIGRYENAMRKLQEMPKYLNGIKAKQIKKIPSDYGVKIDEEIK